MDIDFCIKNYLQNYNLLIEQLTFLFNDEEYKDYIVVLNNESKDKKWLRGIKFQQQISNELFDTFLESKIKLFSHKDENTKNVSESLFGSELSLKNHPLIKEDLKTGWTFLKPEAAPFFVFIELFITVYYYIDKLIIFTINELLLDMKSFKSKNK